MSTRQAWDAAECYGFVVGVLDHFGIMNSIGVSEVENIGPFCLTDSVNANDVTEVVARFLDQHPEKRHLAGYLLTRQALTDGYPCKQ
ncbi:Rap1a/Tai family immunity protein [Mesorhizobium waimense]|uniref:Rap1a/Tai family immunity protein n=1 Tax=Mesorhizobium waimense TaxID=1300307 RepID=UPI0011C397A4|nr:Rap1a/Tai family immunity protein [Mesorhizobium waimense]